MRVMSNAFLSQAEVTQIDRWEYGPLELRFIPEPQRRGHAEFCGLVASWNCDQCAGFLRDGECLESLQQMGLVTAKNPNIVLAPVRCGYSELMGMLGCLLPSAVLKHHRIGRPKANFWLCPSSEAIRFRTLDKLEQYSQEELNQLTDEHLRRLASVIPGAFEQWIWTQLVRRKRYGMLDFSKNASLRLLAGDVRFWMHRLYRIAIDLYESFPPTKHEEDNWRPLEEIDSHLNEVIPEDERELQTDTAENGRKPLGLR